MNNSIYTHDTLSKVLKGFLAFTIVVIIITVLSVDILGPDTAFAVIVFGFLPNRIGLMLLYNIRALESLELAIDRDSQKTDVEMYADKVADRASLRSVLLINKWRYSEFFPEAIYQNKR